MAFMLRVRLDAASDEVSTTILDSLKIMAGLQTEHTALITYHFAKPDPQGRPNHFEFTEVYGNETTWWGHSSNPEFIEAYKSGFGPHVKFSAVTYGYGAGLQGKVKEVCDVVLKCRYPQATAGYVLNPQPWDLTDQKAVLFIARIQAKDGKSKEILQLLNSLSQVTNNGVLVCFSSIPDPESAPNTIELVEVTSTNHHLTSHLCEGRGKEIMKAIILQVDSLTCEGYGSVMAETVELFNSQLGVELAIKDTAAGYVLHPHADPEGK